MFDTICFTRFNPDGDGPFFDARTPYVERVWTSTLGCCSVMLLRAAATVVDAGTPIRLDGHQLAASLGLKLHTAKRSSLCHILQRLEYFGFAGLNDPTVVIQTLLPALPNRLLHRAPDSVQIAHHSLTLAAQQLGRTEIETSSLRRPVSLAPEEGSAALICSSYRLGRMTYRRVIRLTPQHVPKLHARHHSGSEQYPCWSGSGSASRRRSCCSRVCNSRAPV